MNPDLLLQIQPPPKQDFDAFKHKKGQDTAPRNDSFTQSRRQAHEAEKAASQPQNAARTGNDDARNASFSDVMARLRASQTDDASAIAPDISALHFHTQARTVQVNVEARAENALSPGQLLPDNIAALNVELARLIESIREEGQSPQDELIASAAVEEQKGGNEGAISLLAFLLNVLEPEVRDAQGEDSDALVNLLEKIQSLLGENEEDLIASGLTAQDLAALQADLRKLEKEEAAYADAQFLNRLQARLLNLENAGRRNGAGEQQALLFSPEHMKAERYELRYRLDALAGAPEGADENGYDFKSLLKGPQSADFLANPKIAQAFVQNNGASPLPAWMVWGGGESFALSGLDDFSLSTSASGLSAGNPAQALQAGLTSLIAQAPSAGQAHPATQMVAATIQKAVKSGQDTNIKLQLDPPELGRVEVKMSIGKDKAAKIVLTAEKPETFMMLQRDAQALERALHEAGLDSEGSLSFELAAQDHDFGQGNQRGGGHDHGGTGSDAADGAEDLIESTMTWRVDPETGHMRYNILA